MDHTFQYLGDTKSVPPYSHLAELYDGIMVHVDYYHWAKYIHDLMNIHTEKSTQVCDISCGTGSLVLNLASLGHQVTGIDYSESMIKIARQKAAKLSYPLTFKTGDMRHVSLPHPVHIIISLYDSVNYFFEDKDFMQMFHSVHNALSPGGLFIFDISTEHNALKYFLEYNDSGKIGGKRYNRHSYYERDTRVQNTEFAIQYPGKSIWYVEHHRQKIVPIQKIRHIIPSTLFQCLGEYDNLSHKKPNSSSERIHFVLKKIHLTA